MVEHWHLKPGVLGGGVLILFTLKSACSLHYLVCSGDSTEFQTTVVSTTTSTITMGTESGNRQQDGSATLIGEVYRSLSKSIIFPY